MNRAASPREAFRIADIHWPLFLLAAASGSMANFSPMLGERRVLELAAKSIAIAPFFVAAFFARRKEPLRAYYVLAPFGAVFAIAIASWVFNGVGGQAAMRWVVLLAFYAAAARLAWEPGTPLHFVVSIYLGLVVGGTVFSLYALPYSETITDVSFRRAVAGLHPNAQGLVCAGTANAALLLCLVFREKQARAALLLVFACASAAAWVTGSRASLLALAMSMGCAGLLAFGTMGQNKRYIFSACLLPFALAGALLFSEFAYSHLLPNLETMSRTDSIGTLTGRRFTWDFILENMFEPPIFPIGVGPDIGREWLTALTGLHAHNGYLQLVTDLGPFVLIPLACLLVVPAAKAMLCLKCQPKAVLLHTGVCAFTVIHSMAEANMDRLANTMNMAFIFSVVALWQMQPQTQAKQRSSGSHSPGASEPEPGRAPGQVVA